MLGDDIIDVMYKLIDYFSGECVSADSLVFTGENGPWEVKMDLSEVKKRLNLSHLRKTPLSVLKYLPLMPIKDYNNFISLGEGETPLIEAKILNGKVNSSLFFKLEGQNPTGSFKDRGSAIEITVASEYGAKGIVLASTGNMAASCSCYAAAAGIPCYVFVPEGTPSSKLAQVLAYGGRIVQIKGSYGMAARLAEEVARKMNFYLAGDYAFRAEGGKSGAFELVEQLSYHVPDFIVVPVGCGTNLASYYKGFVEFKELGLIDKLPKFIAVQAEGANPVVRAFNKKSKTVEPLTDVRSLASAIAINDPLDGAKALDAIYNSNGFAIDVSEEEMVRAQYELSKEEGLFVETSCAATYAALDKLSNVDGGSLIKGKSIVCILTGTGLKDPNPIIRAAISPPLINASIAEFDQLYKKSLKNPQNLYFLKELEVACSTDITRNELKEIVEKNFKIYLDSSAVDFLYTKMKIYLEKGVPVLMSDLRVFINEVIEETDYCESKIKVKSFRIISDSEKDVVAAVVFEISEDDKKLVKEARSEGVGVIDAIFNSFSSLFPEVKFVLNDFSVSVKEVKPEGTVSVRVELKEGSKTVIARASSLDTISGSVKAFERAFNKILNYESKRYCGV